MTLTDVIHRLDLTPTVQADPVLLLIRLVQRARTAERG